MRAKPKAPVYDSIAPHYDRAMRPLERWLFARLRARVFSNFAEGVRLLEVGAGTGANLPFYPRGTRGAACEPSFEMIWRARRKELTGEVSFIQGCAERLPFADEAFDAAVATLVFCSVVSPAEAFAELRRVVRQGGVIALVEHVRPNGLMGYLFDALNLLTVAIFGDHFNRRTASEAERAGLKLIKVERHALGVINLIVLKN